MIAYIIGSENDQVMQFKERHRTAVLGNKLEKLLITRKRGSRFRGQLYCRTSLGNLACCRTITLVPVSDGDLVRLPSL